MIEARGKNDTTSYLKDDVRPDAQNAQKAGVLRGY